MSGSKAYYGVKRGRVPGIYYNWNDCEDQVRGFTNARFKRFNSFKQAETFIKRPPSPLSERRYRRYEYRDFRPPPTLPPPTSQPSPSMTGRPQTTLSCMQPPSVPTTTEHSPKRRMEEVNDDEIVIVAYKKVRVEGTSSSDASQVPITTPDAPKRDAAPVIPKKKQKKAKKKASARKAAVAPATSVFRSSEGSNQSGSKSSVDPMTTFFVQQKYTNPVAFKYLDQAGFTVHELRSMQGLAKDIVTQRFKSFLSDAEGGKMGAMVESLAFAVTSAPDSSWDEVNRNIAALSE